MKKLLFVIIAAALSVGNVQANLLEKLPLTPKQILIGTAIGTATLCIRALFKKNSIAQEDKLADHLAYNHQKTNQTGTSHTLQFDETNTCKDSKNKTWCEHTEEWYSGHREQSYFGIPLLHTLTTSIKIDDLEKTYRYTCKPVFEYPILRSILPYLLYPVTYFSRPFSPPVES